MCNQGGRPFQTGPHNWSVGQIKSINGPGRCSLNPGLREEPVIVLPREAAGDEVARRQGSHQLDNLQVRNLLDIWVLWEVVVLFGDDNTL